MRSASRAAVPVHTGRPGHHPTLILQGAADDRCPVGQPPSSGSRRAARARRPPRAWCCIPVARTSFVLSGPPSHRADYSQRVIDWVEQYAPPARHARARPARRPSLAAATERAGRSAQGARRDPRHPASRRGAGICAPRHTQRAHGHRDHRRLRVPDRLDGARCGRRPRSCASSIRVCSTSTPRVVSYVPEFSSSDPEITRTVTLRHLLNHTSGDRRRCLHRHRPRRRHAREIRRAPGRRGTEPPARRDHVVLQLRILAGRGA